MNRFVLHFALFGSCNSTPRIVQTLWHVAWSGIPAGDNPAPEPPQWFSLSMALLAQVKSEFAFFSPQVSVVKSEETKMRQEDLSRLLYEVQILRSQQENMECQVQDMKQWVESYSGCFLWAFASLEWWIVGNGWEEEPCTSLPGSTWSQGLTRDLLTQQHVKFLCISDL